MGNSPIKKISFEDVSFVQKNNGIIISTLPEHKQNCLISGTVDIKDEEKVINDMMNTDIKQYVVIYGEHANDDSVFKKYKQLISLGFYNVFVYSGGLFEWLLLQDIYGIENFKTTTKELDIYKYRPPRILNVHTLCN